MADKRKRSYKDLQVQAKHLFINTDLSRIAIADTVGVDEKTIRTWVKKFDWETEKETMTITRTGLMRDAYKQLADINAEIKRNGGKMDKATADIKASIRKEIEMLSHFPLHKYTEVQNQFLAYVAENHPQEVKMVSSSSLSLDFIHYIRKKDEQ